MDFGAGCGARMQVNLGFREALAWLDGQEGADLMRCGSVTQAPRSSGHRVTGDRQSHPPRTSSDPAQLSAEHFGVGVVFAAPMFCCDSEGHEAA